MSKVHTVPCALVFAAALIMPGSSSAQEQPKEPKTYTVAGESLRGYQSLESNLADAAEKMPEEHYGFKPTPDVKSFGQHVAHIAISQYGICSRLKGEANPKKDEIALLKGSTSYSEPLVTAITDANLTEMLPMGQDKVQRALIPLALISHADEVYGSMAVYLRLKGIVPPSTEKAKAMKKEAEQSKKSSQ
jgi:hypothetical protein